MHRRRIQGRAAFYCTISGRSRRSPYGFIDHEDGPLSEGRFAGATYAEFVVQLLQNETWEVE